MYRQLPTLRSTLMVALLGVTTLAGCKQPPPNNDAAQAGKEAPAAAPGHLHADQAWTRAIPEGANVAGGFMTLRNESASDDRLVQVSSPLSDEVQIHETSMSDGMMRMRQLPEGIALPAGQVVELKPGGLHLMFMSPKHALSAGQEIEATLRFEHAPPQVVKFAVQAVAEMPPGKP
ncbi:copper chaperone PCu(A)C [Lysobacter pythonis]|uniref:Copper chaperone PCu(A)C n=1 Tax=Solilutibacter pythonis TaxID=2483112 RepID=A0A3M2HNR2_9GAMM|nr:copper chaperone PCu(A)C [Lysobacter pythonis]RMH87887.1 copper chaperone PCu(A)C [Lysobacter pythonis]